MLVLLLAACTTPLIHPETPIPQSSRSSQIACQPSPKQTDQSGFPEIQGMMQSDGEMWALLFFDQAQTNKDEKIVWRITGDGMDFSAVAHDESGTVIEPVWGPEYHGGSTWHRPGQEWGTGFNFPTPGCWTIRVARGTTVGEIRLAVKS